MRGSFVFKGVPSEFSPHTPIRQRKDRTHSGEHNRPPILPPCVSAQKKGVLCRLLDIATSALALAGIVAAYAVFTAAMLQIGGVR